MKRLIGIGAVWVGCTLAWLVLGSTLVVRSGESSALLSPKVHELWGPPLEQAQPTAEYGEKEQRSTTHMVTDHGMRSMSTTTSEWVGKAVPLVATDIEADLDLEHRRRGLVFFPTYEVDFRARYTFESPAEQTEEVTFTFPLQAQNVIYDGFVVRDAAGELVPVRIENGSASWTQPLEPGERVSFDVAYRARGTGSWHYRMAHRTTRVTDFRLVMTTNFDDVDFPAGTLSPSEHGREGAGWRGVWRFESLIANQPIGIEPPSLINPGPLAARITFFAPVGLLFFFFVVAVLGEAQNRALHPMHFFFLGCSFFAFHLLFAYLVDHVSIAIAFALSAAVSSFLVISYARLFVGWRFAVREIGLSQLIYLVLFSATFMLKGLTGLSITIGAILTLFVMMQITGRARRKNAPPTAQGTTEGAIPQTF